MQTSLLRRNTNRTARPNARRDRRQFGHGLETARLARARGADVILTARDADNLREAAQQIGARGTAAFDATDLARLERFFADLPGPVDHVMVTGPGTYYSSWKDMDFAAARRDIDQRLLVRAQ